MPESVSQHCKAFLVSQQIKGAMDRTILHCRDDFKRHISIKHKLKDLKIHDVFYASFLKPYYDETFINYLINRDVKLDPKIFKRICKQLKFDPNINVFASKIHHQLQTYCPLDPTDSEAFAHNGFTLPFGEFKAYYNPPFYYIGKLLRKLCFEGVQALCVAPVLPDAKWFPLWRKLTVRKVTLNEPCFLYANKKLRQTPPWPIEAAILDGSKASEWERQTWLKT
jgi:hypothetical protein